MKKFIYNDLKKKEISGELYIPSDKSITHRAFIMASVCKGESLIKNPLLSEDCLNTLKALSQTKINYKILNNGDVLIESKEKFTEPNKEIYLGNSGTGIRLLTGLFSAQKNINFKLFGDNSLNSRPMDRIIIPLSQMGAKILANKNKFAPLIISGQKLSGIKYFSPIPSAQIKSAILLAGLFANKETIFSEIVKSRDHTEKLFQFLGIDIKISDNTIYLNPLDKILENKEFFIPGDISSAAFFIVLGILTSDKELLIKNVGLNPTRDAIIKVLQRMNANIKIENEKIISGEKIGDIFVKKSDLIGTEISGNEIPLLIDEIPIISVLALFAKTKTTIRDAKELRYKECNRIIAIKSEFTKFGANITELDNGLIIEPNINKQNKKINLTSFYDHRIAMCEIILAIIQNQEIEIDDISCIKTSFPNFFKCLKNIGAINENYNS